MDILDAARLPPGCLFVGIEFLDMVWRQFLKRDMADGRQNILGENGFLFQVVV